MSNNYFAFKQFTVHQDQATMKVTTDACLFGAWVATYLERFGASGKRLLDIGAGTALLSLMVAQKNRVEIDAVELDEFSVVQARENVSAAPFGSAIRVIAKDITRHEENNYDFIISNPPFYEKEILSASAEKRQAHHGEGLTWEQLFSIIKKQLDNEGKFFLLLPHKRQNDLTAFLKKENLFLEESVTVRHTTSHPPLRFLVRGSKKQCITSYTDLVIKDEACYSPEFAGLLKDYYLYL